MNKSLNQDLLEGRINRILKEKYGKQD